MTPPLPPPAAPFQFQPLRTLRFSMIIATAFTLLTFALTSSHPSWHTASGWSRAIGTSVVFSGCIGFTIDALFTLVRRALGTRFATLAGWRRALFLWGTPLLGVAIGLSVASLLTGAGHSARARTRTSPTDRRFCSSTRASSWAIP